MSLTVGDLSRAVGCRNGGQIIKTMSRAFAPCDLPAVLLGLMGVEASCAASANVADQVWIDHAALCQLDRCVCELVAHHAGPQDFQHAAYVLNDGGLAVFGWSPQAGYFAFRVSAGRWGWVRRPC